MGNHCTILKNPKNKKENRIPRTGHSGQGVSDLDEIWLPVGTASPTEEPGGKVRTTR
jgi:hypothetical protein